MQKHAIGDVINYNDFNMYRVNVEIYKGFIFANLDPKPKNDLSTFLGDFKFYFDLVSNRSEAGLSFTNPQRWVVPFNWKAAADNLLVIYITHLPRMQQDMRFFLKKLSRQIQY